MKALSDGVETMSAKLIGTVSLKINCGNLEPVVSIRRMTMDIFFLAWNRRRVVPLNESPLTLFIVDRHRW